MAPPLRILVVDDDPDIVEYLSSFLGDNGYQVQSAESGEVALQVVDEFCPDAVLIDVMLPGRSGLDLMSKLRRNPRWSDLPLFVVTGNDKIVVDECHSYFNSYDGIRGPDGVLGKPVDRTELLRVLGNLHPPSPHRRSIPGEK